MPDYSHAPIIQSVHTLTDAISRTVDRPKGVANLDSKKSMLECILGGDVICWQSSVVVDDAVDIATVDGAELEEL